MLSVTLRLPLTRQSLWKRAINLHFVLSTRTVSDAALFVACHDPTSPSLLIYTLAATGGNAESPSQSML